LWTLLKDFSKAPYRLATETVFGKEHAFFLDTQGDWERFVKEVLKSYEKKP